MQFGLIVMAVSVIYVMPFSFIVLLYKRELKRLENKEQENEK